MSIVTSASLNRRRNPDRKSAPINRARRGPLKRGTVGNFVGWRYGENVGGNNVWFQRTSGNWFRSGGLDGGARTTGLKNLSPKVTTATRTVRTFKDSTTINGRSQPRNYPPVRQKLKRWTTGTFNGNWFWAGNFTSQSTAGLPKV